MISDTETGTPAAAAVPAAVPSRPPLLELQGVTKRYGRKATALSDISLTLHGGGIGLLGPNGAGKSTLIKSLLGLVRLTSGSASVLGYDVRKRSRRIRRSVGYMPEDDDAIPGMTGIEAVSFSAELCGISRHAAFLRAHESLDFCGIGDERYRVLRTLAPGTRQRFHLARALVHGPRLVFLDEPTAGLDPAGREWMLGLIRDLWEKHGVNVIFSTHILNDIEVACDQVVIIKLGTLVAQGRIDQLRTTDTSRLRVQYRGDERDFVHELRQQGVGDVRILGPGQLMIDAEQGGVPPAVLRAAVAANVRLRHIAPNATQLEDIFLNAVAATRRYRRETLHG
ncbi:MAG: ABC transporter ATP-binding protein [Planctomycetota bacterium]